MILAVDAGQSACRVLIRDDAIREFAWASDGVVSGQDPFGPVLAAIESAVEAAAVALGDVDIDTVAVGMTGLHGRAVGAERLLRWSRERIGARRAIVADDSVTSFFGALCGAPGVVIAAGTGVCVLAVDALQRHFRVDGWGPLLGDAGGGYWVGARGLAEAMRAADGRAGSPALLDRVRSLVEDVGLLPKTLAADPARVSWIARFAKDVAAAAEHGDAVAQAIWSASAQLLAESVAAAARPLFGAAAVTVAYTGRLFDAGELLTPSFANEVMGQLPNATVKPAAGTSLDGAVRIAGIEQIPDLSPLVAVAELGGGA